MSTLVLITVAGNSWQFFRTFRTQMLEQIQDSLQSQAERSKDQIETTIDTWRSQVAIALPTMRPTKVDKSKNENSVLQRFVDANPDFFLIQILSAPSTTSSDFSLIDEALTSHINDKNFEDKDAHAVAELIKTSSINWLKGVPGKTKSNSAIESQAKISKLPLVTLAIRFEVANSQGVVWAVLTAWQTPLNKALSKSTFIKSSIIDRSGKIFASLDPLETINRPTINSRSLLKSALSSDSPSGFEQVYKDGKGKDKVGAYARLQRYPLILVIEQDANAATQAVKKTLLSTSLWAGLFILMAVMFSFLASSQITKGLRAVTYATGRIAAGDFAHKVPPGSQDEVGALGSAVNNMSRKIVDLMASQVDKARVEKELETAKMVQSTFFPRAAINLPNVRVAGFYTPASECGGDLWGHYTISDGLEFIFIADAMGHGAPAALVTAMAYSTTMTVADIIKHEPSFRDSPSSILERLNRIIYEAVQGTISMTFFASIVDTNKGILTYANAGHNFPVIVPTSPTDSRLGKAAKEPSKSGTIQPISLKLMGTPLGMDRDSQYKERTIDLVAGDKIFYFTDGLIECTSPKGDAIGRKHLLADVSTFANLAPEAMISAIKKRAFEFFASQPLADDITIVVAEIDKVRQHQTEPIPEHPHTPQDRSIVTPESASVTLDLSTASPSQPEVASLQAAMAAPELPSGESHTTHAGVVKSEGAANPSAPARTTIDSGAWPKVSSGGGKYKLKLPSVS